MIKRSHVGPRLALLAAALIWTVDAFAAPKTCCNRETGEFLPLSHEECRAQGHAPFDTSDPTAAAAARVCFLGTHRTAEDKLEEMGLPTSRTLGGQIPGSAEELAEMLGGGGHDDETIACCDTNSGTFTDPASPDACRENGAGFYPDLPEHLADVQACRRSSGKLSASAWSRDDYVENIENGGMERWRDEFRPDGFTTFGVDPSLSAGQGIDIQVVFRDTDAHTGEYSALLRNRDVLPDLPPESRGIVRRVLGSDSVVTSAGMLTCGNPCVPENPTQQVPNTLSGAATAIASLPADDVQSHVCGAYKGFIGRSDQLRVDLTLVSGQQVAGGASASFTESTSEWIEFIMPMSGVVGELPPTGEVAITARVEPRSTSGNPTADAAAGQVQWRMSALTAVNVDSIHFCDPMGLTAYHPAVLVDGKTDDAVAESEETSVGVQTFVNTDNDDKDGLFDLDDDKVADDDELVRILLYMPLNSFGTVRFNAPQLGDGRYALWSDAAKSRPFGDANQDREVLELLRTTPDGQRYEREIWVEALQPSTSPGDIEFEFVFEDRTRTGRVARDALRMTALAIDSIKFEGRDNSVDDTSTLDEDPNWPLSDPIGVRVFPGKRWDAANKKPEDDARELVDVVVDLNVAPPRPVTLYFRAFDVDDPTAFDNEVDDESSADDNRGTKPSPTGAFPNLKSDIRDLEFRGRSASFEFQTTMQPGDNFRIAGSGDRDHLDAIENDDTRLSSVVADRMPDGEKLIDRHVWEVEQDLAAAELRFADRSVSPVLTVWRKLYFEIDKMTEVKDNELEGFIKSVALVSPDEPEYQQYELTIDKNIFANLPDLAKTTNIGVENAYKRGSITINKQRLGVLYSTARNSGNDTITIAFYKTDNRGSTIEDIVGVDSVVDLPFTLRDNDQYRNDDALGDIPMGQMQPVYARAYVLPVLEPVSNNPNPTVPFLLNYQKDDADYLRDQYAFDNERYHEDPKFWLVYLLTAFQGMTSEDGDGGYFEYLGLGGFKAEGAISGQADNLPGGIEGRGATIFLESGRELEDGKQGRPGWRLSDTAPHEVGHLFGGDHRDGGLMDDRDAQKSNHFSPKSLDLVRGKPYP